jgi:hypothetical protein
MLLCGAFFSGCAVFSKESKFKSAPTLAPIVESPVIKSVPGKAVVYIYREKDDFAATRNPKISLSEQILFEAKVHQYKKLELAPGEYDILVTGYDLGNSALKAKFESDKIYFIQFSAKAGRETGRHLYVVSSAQAQKDIQNYKETN